MWPKQKADADQMTVNKEPEKEERRKERFNKGKINYFTQSTGWVAMVRMDREAMR